MPPTNELAVMERWGNGEFSSVYEAERVYQKAWAQHPVKESKSTSKSKSWKSKKSAKAKPTATPTEDGGLIGEWNNEPTRAESDEDERLEYYYQRGYEIGSSHKSPAEKMKALSNLVNEVVDEMDEELDNE